MRAKGLLALALMHGMVGDMTLDSPLASTSFTPQSAPPMPLNKKRIKARKKSKAASKARNKNRR